MPEFLRGNGRVHHFRFRPGTARVAVVFVNSLGTDFRIWDDVMDAMPSDVPILRSNTSGHGLSEALAGYRAMLSRTPSAGDLDVCAAIRDADLSEATGRIACPTHCVAVSDDLTKPPEIVRGLAAKIDGTAFTCLDGVGHLPCIEAVDQLVAILRDRMEALA